MIKNRSEEIKIRDGMSFKETQVCTFMLQKQLTAKVFWPRVTLSQKQ